MSTILPDYLLKQCAECQGLGKVDYEMISTSFSSNPSEQIRTVKIVCPLCSGSGVDPDYKEPKEMGAGDDYPVIQ